MKSRINNPDRAKQLIDFAGLDVDGYIYPTDIDGLIEYKNSEYIMFEIKHGRSDVPFGQKLALQRMADDFASAGKASMVLICEHSVHNADKNVIAARCRVREIYYGGKGEWETPEQELTVREAVDMFHTINEEES